MLECCGRGLRARWGGVGGVCYSVEVKVVVWCGGVCDCVCVCVCVCVCGRGGEEWLRALLFRMPVLCAVHEVPTLVTDGLL